MDDLTSDSLTEASESPAAGAIVAGRYRVRARLGRGASKEVYLAYDERLDREVALAIVVGVGGGAAARERVEREARVTGRLGDHPNVITVYDSGEIDGLPYLVLRAMTGGSLADLLGRPPDERPRIDDAIRIAREIAAALAHAHGHGIVHRDVKPDNVWLADDGSAALGDFGIAYELGRDPPAGERGLVGTVRYLSPEQARGDVVGSASDLYSLGITLYEMVAGCPPFTGNDSGAILAKHMSTAPAPPSQHEPAIQPALEQLILDLLAKNPAARPASAAAVADVLASIEASAGVAGRDRLVGREPVLGRLMAAWSGALAGRPGIVALSGEPGIGKTRCVQELERMVTGAGAMVASGMCAENEGVAAFWPWTRALRELAPPQRGAPLEALLGEHSGDGTTGGATVAEARFRLFDSVAAQLEEVSAQRPHLIVLEDLHWADRSSIELLVHVARELRHGRVLIVLTYRSEELADGHPLADALGELARRPAFERLELRGLNAADVASYVELATGRPTDAPLAAALHARTGGNPFFVSEVVRLLTEDGTLEAAAARGPVLPDAVRDVVSARLARLPATTRSVIEAAAVAGQQFAIGLVASTARISRADLLEALGPAVSQHVVAPGPDPTCWRFRHAIIRDAVYDAVKAPQRADLHTRVGTLLAERRARGQPQPASEPAHHFLEAARAGADPQPALDAAVAAADEAAGQLAHAEAAEQYEAALEAADLAEAGGSERCRLLLGLAEMRRRAGDIGAARSCYETAAQVARGAGSSEIFAEAVLGYSRWQLYGTVDQDAIELLEEALRRLGTPDSAQRARLLGRLAVRLDPRREQTKREAVMDDAIAMSRRLADRAVLARLLADSAALHHRPESAARRDADTAETMFLAREAGDQEAALWAHSVRFVEAFGAGNIAAADAELDAFALLAGEQRQPYYRWALTMMRATREVFDGHLQIGRRLATEAYEFNCSHELGSDEEYPVQLLVLAVAADQRPQDSDIDLLRGVAAEYGHLPLWRALITYVDWCAGDEDAARRGLELLARDGFTAAARDVDAICTLSLTAETCAGLGDGALAPVLHRLLQPHRDRNVVVERGWGALGAAAHGLGLLAATTGDVPLARDHFARALELNRRWGARPWERRTIRAASRYGIELR